MSPLIETIKLSDGRFCNLEYHNSRFNHARWNYFGKKETVNLEDYLVIPHDKIRGKFKCRITYSPDIENIEFLHHIIRPVHTLKLIQDDEVNYRFKFKDRKRLADLFEKRGTCDDILIVSKGCITDSYTANAIFFDGKNWWTPDTPLLEGTQRARLLAENKILERRILISNLSEFKKVGLINAMQDLQEMPVIEISSLTW